MLKLIFALLLCSPAVAALAATAIEPREGIREQVFNQADNALERANASGASVLTPGSYSRAATAYHKAETAFDNKVNLDQVRNSLTQAELYFDQAAQSAPFVLAQVESAYQARLDALKASADTLSPDLWMKAEQLLHKATTRVENGRSTRISKYTEKAEVLYREAELTAIKAALFTSLNAEIERARKIDAQDWSPKSFGFAIDLLSQAHFEIDQDRYAVDLPRSLVNRGMHAIKHAQYVALLAAEIDDNDKMLEDVLLEWESHIQELAIDFGRRVYFDEGPRESIGLLRSSLASNEIRRMADEQTLAETRRRLSLLEDELALLSADFDGRDQLSVRPKKLMVEEQRTEEHKRLQAIFEPNEAQILLDQNQLIIRLVALDFSSGTADIEGRHYALLAKLREALALFPDASITIEGHTDSEGNKTGNLDLSTQRADAVASYLLATTSISPVRLSASGYGEERPIADNNIEEGRLMNRRIDVVLQP